MLKYLQHFLTSFLFVFFAFKAQSQIAGIKISGDTCTNFTISLQVLGTSSSPYFFWNFDDPTSGDQDTITITGLSSPPFPTHTFKSAGVYNVCVSFQEPGFTVTTVCRKLSIGLCCNGIISLSDTCLRNNIQFSIITGATIKSVNWNFDDPTSGTNNTSNALTPSHVFSSIGDYNIRSTVNFVCGIDSLFKTVRITMCDSLIEGCQLIVPSAFTPNLDGTNDMFYPLTICPTEYYEFSIYDRWGEQIFKTSNPSEKWDGKFNGLECSIGDYIYVITFKFARQKTRNTYGTIKLLK
jgi:gliding motility-associated-like protein